MLVPVSILNLDEKEYADTVLIASLQCGYPLSKTSCGRSSIHNECMSRDCFMNSRLLGFLLKRRLFVEYYRCSEFLFIKLCSPSDVDSVSYFVTADCF